MICQRDTCKKEFNEKEQIVFVHRRQKMIKCPFCKSKYFFIKYSKGYERLKNGQLVRTDQRIRMSKKERLKLRRKNKELMDSGSNN